jgi:hypothetical protein
MQENNASAAENKTQKQNPNPENGTKKEVC